MTDKKLLERRNWEVQTFAPHVFPIRINTDCAQCNARHVIWLSMEDVSDLHRQLKAVIEGVHLEPHGGENE